MSDNEEFVRRPPRKQKSRTGTSRQKHDDAFREKVGKKVDEDYRAEQTRKIFPRGVPTTKPPRPPPSQKSDQRSGNVEVKQKFPLGLTELSIIASTRVVPYVTCGLGFLVNDIYYRLRTLMQLEMQMSVTHEQPLHR